MKNIITLLYWLIIAPYTTPLSAQNSLSFAADTGSATTTSASFTDITNMSVSLDVTDVNAVLVYSSFTCNLSGTAGTRTASYQFFDGTTAKGGISRSLNVSKSTDYGIGSAVTIYDASSQSGNINYSLQHNITSSKTLSSSGTIVAIALSDDASTPNHLNHSSVDASSPVTASGTWAAVTGSTTPAITQPSTGGFFVAASIESSASSTPGMGNWKLQYSTDNTNWNDIGDTKHRTISSTTSKGIISLLGTLPNSTTAGSYYFRIAHQSTAGTVSTDRASLVVVALGVSGGVNFPVFQDFLSGSASNSTTDTTDVMLTNITPDIDMDVFLSSIYNMTADAEILDPTFDLYVHDDGSYIYNSYDQRRYLSSANDTGSGVSIGVAENLVGSTQYDVSLRQASDGTNSLTSFNTSIAGFGLTSGTNYTLPIELLSFDYIQKDESVILVWETASERNNDYFSIEKSEDGKNWRVIGNIEAAGNSNHHQQYEFIDKEINTAQIYYRLRQTDYNGKFSYSRTISILQKKSLGDLISISPNPSSELIQIQIRDHLDTDYLISMYDATGKEIMTLNNTIKQVEINISDLDVGIYFVRISCGNKIAYNKFVKQ